jgi:hypothetical protein
MSLWYVWRKSFNYLALTLTQSENDPKGDSTRPTSPRSSIECVQRISKLVVRSAQTVHLSCAKISNISKWTELSFHLSLSPNSTIGFTQNNFWAYGMFGANLAPILRQHYHYLQTDWIEVPLEPRHLGVPPGASKTISKPMYVRRKPCTYLASRLPLSPNGLNQASTWAL